MISFLIPALCWLLSRLLTAWIVSRWQSWGALDCTEHSAEQWSPFHLLPTWKPPPSQHWHVISTSFSAQHSTSQGWIWATSDLLSAWINPEEAFWAMRLLVIRENWKRFLFLGLVINTLTILKLKPHSDCFIRLYNGLHLSSCGAAWFKFYPIIMSIPAAALSVFNKLILKLIGPAILNGAFLVSEYVCILSIVN